MKPSKPLRVRVGALIAASVALWPLAAAAQSDSPAARDFTPERIQAAFVRDGYAVENPIYWSWTSPPVTTFRVHDPAFDRRTVAELPNTDRVVMVLVYSDTTSALAAQQQAEAREQADGRDSLTFGENSGPRLVPGYGQSVWRRNVALVQSSESALRGAYAAQLERDNTANAVTTTAADSAVAFMPLVSSTYYVDADFVAATMDALATDL